MISRPLSRAGRMYKVERDECDQTFAVERARVRPYEEWERPRARDTWNSETARSAQKAWTASD